MAENSKGGLLNKAEKLLRRRKTQVLQSLGKQGKTTDDILAEDCQRLEKQQEVANKFQKDLRHYVHSARALSTASKTFYTTVAEAYEPEWENHAQITEILANMDMLWQDYLQKLQEQVQEPLTKYLATIPQIKARVSKRGRKLIDYDNARHSLEVHQNAKKKDDTKLSKVQEDLDQAKKIYEDLNNELHQELPEFFNSRVSFYGNLFQSLFSAENVFQSEAGKGSQTISSSAEKLASDHEHYTYTPRKSIRSTVMGKDRGDVYRDSLQIPFFFRNSMLRDDSMTNGHSENRTESPQPDSPSSSTSQSSPMKSVPVSTPEPVTNGTAEADTSKDSIEQDESYVNTPFKDNKPNESEVEEAGANVPLESTAVNDTKVEVETEIKAESEVKVKSEVKVESEVKAEPTESHEPPTETDSQEKKETDEKQEVQEEVKVNGDLDTSTEQEVPEDAPPPVPVSMPPSDEVVKENAVGDTVDGAVDGSDDDDDDDSGLYQVPPPAKPVANDLPPNYLYTEKDSDQEDEILPPKYLYTVVATHTYKGEDDDELTFDAQEIIYVIQYDDPDEQDPGWLMGVRKIGGKTGVFPENFTKKV